MLAEHKILVIYLFLFKLKKCNVRGDEKVLQVPHNSTPRMNKKCVDSVRITREACKYVILPLGTLLKRRQMTENKRPDKAIMMKKQPRHLVE